MRLFAAIPVSDPVRQLVERVLGTLAPLEWPVRWTRPDTVHLTVKFYGEVALDGVDAVVDALHRAVQGTGPLPLEVGGAGAFPSARKARVVWLGLEGPSALELLHHRVEVAAAEVGYPSEGRPFRPHLTLGRVRQRERLPQGAEEVLEGLTERVTFLAQELTLFESHVRPGGARHRVVSSLALDAA